jgi:UDP-3-O-[3-hydroxymyristoyl] glucosamine N-acyltransferase
VLGAQAGVTNSIDAGAFVAGYPAIDTRVWRKGSVVFKRLPELKSRIEQLEEQVAELTRALTQSERSSG